ILLSNHNTKISANISFLKQNIRISTSQMALDILGRSAKVAKDPDRYCKLKSHAPEQNTFIGKQFYLVSSPLFDEIKKQHNALGTPRLEPNFNENSFILCFL
ncbi:hypothetical protein VP01_3350g1, partial [Puccinia sorghi]